MKVIFSQSFILIIIAALIAGCAGQGLSQQPTGQNSGPMTLAGGAPEPGQPQGTRPPMSGEGVTSSAADSGNVSSNGAQSGPVAPQGPSSGSGSGPVLIGGSEAQGTPVSSDNINSTNVKWLTYTDKKYGFSLQYPDTYVIQPEVEPGPYMGTKAVYQVRWQDKELAKSDVANLEPPKFSIEVYKMKTVVGLQDWLTANKLVPPKATVDKVELKSGAGGVRITLATLNAPNVFYFFAVKDVVYRVIPLGAFNDAMLGSLKL